MDALTSTIWWKQVAGPVNLTEHIARELINNHSIILVTPPDLPWRHEMRYSIEELTKGEGLSFDMIDSEDECLDKKINSNNIGRFLLERFGTKNDVSGYRPHKETIGQYLLSRCILKDKVIWIKGIPDEQLEAWVTFYCDYKGKTREHGLFVIETNSNPAKYRFSSQTIIIKYTDYISKYDTHLFASLILSQSTVPNFFHQYITAVASNVCITDAEVAAHMIQEIDFTVTDPLDGLEKLFQKYYSQTKRGCVNNMQEAHPFYLIRKDERQKLTRRLWSAQLQVAFPKVEEKRIEFIQKYENELKDCLPITQFETTIYDPYELELGTISYLASKKREEMGLKRLFIPVVSDNKELQFLHNIRNKLAHVELCTPEEMTRLLSSRSNL